MTLGKHLYVHCSGLLDTELGVNMIGLLDRWSRKAVCW